MQDSTTKIQQPELSKPENGWAFFFKPNEGLWYHIKGPVKEFVDELQVDNSIEQYSGGFAESGFYFKRFASDSALHFISGEADVVVEEHLGLLLGGCLRKSNIKHIESIADSTLRLDFDREIIGIKEEIESGKFIKMVAARKRTWEIESWDEAQLLSILIDLKANYLQTFVFVLFTEDLGLWIGATPEQLITLKHSQANIMALAGTLTEEQSHWTIKEQEEQQVTHDFIGKAIYAMDLPFSPLETNIREINLKRVKHLLREWKFQLNYKDVYRLVEALHPTPAVGGFPQKESVTWLEQNETFDRKLYTGWMGYADAKKETIDFYVVLRCGELFSNALTCYAGCGVNLGSDLEVEWKETEYKLAMLADVVFKHIKPH